MQENMTVTVEPGCYFIDHLLDEAIDDDSPLKPFLNAELLEEYRGFGGVRLEDVVAITANGCVNYTLCPRTVNEIEHVMAGGKWPPYQG
jgi:Xaa-Pro dipeptidase